ncbi:hypothetical protein M514_01921 [Trichuris suis]|uniref:Uncharacterized protein n=1 Tax=Trichuris suis TaxID=68888 RepID=A0A085NJA8_9BILA|nr:hypothetical protein M513_01921 [Trichuris suis]KFD69554.1 hypothetical protein M514_01921 [Trichuris suis]
MDSCHENRVSQNWSKKQAFKLSPSSKASQMAIYLSRSYRRSAIVPKFWQQPAFSGSSSKQANAPKEHESKATSRLLHNFQILTLNARCSNPLYQSVKLTIAKIFTDSSVRNTDGKPEVSFVDTTETAIENNMKIRTA